MRAIAAAAAGVLCLASVASADTLLTSFENSFTGTREAYTSFTTEFGVTEGSYALDIATPAPTFNASANQWSIYAQAFKASVDYDLLINAPVKQLAIDMTMPVGPTNAWWWEIQLVFNAEAFGYQQSPKLNVDSSPMPTPTTLVWDYSAINFSTLPANPSWHEVVLVINAGGPETFAPAPHIYVDNLRIVPEPSSLLALGAVPVLLRRRRH